MIVHYVCSVNKIKLKKEEEIHSARTHYAMRRHRRRTLGIGWCEFVCVCVCPGMRSRCAIRQREQRDWSAFGVLFSHLCAKRSLNALRILYILFYSRLDSAGTVHLRNDSAASVRNALQ